MPVPMVVAAVAAFLLSGPTLHVALTLCASDAPSLMTVEALVQLAFLISLTSFLATLLSIRQIFEHLGMSYSTAIYTRWVSGVALTGLCYPALRFYGLDSHFLPLLPVAIAMFAALGVVMALKKKTYTLFVLSMVLVGCLSLLFLLWVQRMPHHLPQFHVGGLSLGAFYTAVCLNFVLCLTSLFSASRGQGGMLGLSMVAQCIVLAICELSLHHANLYPSSLIQLTAGAGLYVLHRLNTVQVLPHIPAMLASAVLVAKSATVWTGMLAGKSGSTELLDLACLAVFAGAVLQAFVYTPLHNVRPKWTLPLLLFGLLACWTPLLQPLSQHLLQSADLSGLLGLWLLLGGGLVLLYSQSQPQALTLNPVPTQVGEFSPPSNSQSNLIPLALLMSLVGVVVVVLQPNTTLSLMSLFEWLEILSGFCLAGLVAYK